MAKKGKKTKEELEKVDKDGELEYNGDADLEFLPAQAGGDVEENFQDKLKKLKEELKKCRKEKQGYLDGWQRSRADYANLKVEEGKKRAQITEFTKEEILSTVLPVLDSFDIAFSNKEALKKVDKNWRTGIEHIYNQLSSILKNHGISEISEAGVSFDPELHQSVETVGIKNEKEDNTVSEIVSKGYKMNGKVLRPARVKVFRKIPS